jgi:cytochrome b561
MTTSSRYTGPAILFHWLIALLVLIALPLGLTMSKMDFSPLTMQLVIWHKSIGVTVLLAALLRLIWRITHRPPSLPANMSALERTLTKLGHGLLYVLIFAIPLSGWMMSSAKGYPTVYLGLVELPNLLEKNLPLGKFLDQVHAMLNWVLAGTLLLHVLAAVKHHYIDRDDVLIRMLPRRRSRKQ